MFGGPSPLFLLFRSLDAFVGELDGLRDGKKRAIHDARVAIRRTREALALARRAYDADDVEDIEERLRRFFKALGQARDADIGHDLVRHVERRFTLAPAALSHLRASTADRQLTARRQVIKTLEALEVDAIPRQLARARRAIDRTTHWRGLLRTQLSHRAGEARDALAHASGVYFRNRAHSARIALKQFRYTLELADATQTFHIPRAMRTLRRAQDVLGEAHDREVLLEQLHELEQGGVAVNAAEVAVLDHFLRGEIRSLHEEYLDTRDELRDICAACDRAPRHSLVMRTAALAALTLPAALLIRHQGQRRLLPAISPQTTGP